PAPNGAGGDFVSPGMQGYGTGIVGCGRVECAGICNPDVRAQRWAWMDKQAIIPPNIAAGIDLAGSDTWSGLTVDDAEKYNGKGGDDPGTEITPGTLSGGLCES